MLTRIELVNFMSHVHTVIEPAAGLTVLVGPNNCGKSAIVAALNLLCRNKPAGSWMLRHGEKEAVVIVETDGEHTVEWHRKARTTSYRIDGRDVHRLGRSDVPDDLHELLKMPEVRSNDGKLEFDVHFGQQKSPIFLLDQPGSHAAVFFAASSDASHLVEMQGRHRENVTAARREQKRLSTELAELTAQLDRLAPLDALGAGLEQVEASHEALLAAEQLAQQLAAAVSGLDAATRSAASATARTAALQTLASPPDMAPADALAELATAIATASSEVDRSRLRCDALAGIAPPPALADVVPLTSLVENLTRASLLAEASQAIADQLADLPELPTLRDPVPLVELIERLADAEQAAVACQAKAAGANKALAAAKHALNQWVAANPTCPTCGAKLDADRLIAMGGHRHE